MSLDPEHEAMNTAYAISNRLASSFCSDELMRYLDINLAGDGETFFDSMIVGAEFSRMPSDEGRYRASLELRILGAWHDCGLVLRFREVSYYSPGNMVPSCAADIQWIEFIGDEDERRCKLHLLGTSDVMEVGFRHLAFEVIPFDEMRKDVADFYTTGDRRGQKR